MQSPTDLWDCSSPEQLKELAQEHFILAVTEEIWEAMERRQINKLELAERLGTGKSYISQLLSGSRNMTLRTLSDVAAALDQHLSVTLHNVEEKRQWQPLVGLVRTSSSLVFGCIDTSAVNDGSWMPAANLRT